MKFIDENKEEIEIIMRVTIFTKLLFIILSLLIIILSFLYIIDRLDIREEICDYDSCSQESVSGNWNYTGLACFNENDPNCSDFLKFWTACQEYKKRIGVC